MEAINSKPFTIDLESNLTLRGDVRVSGEPGKKPVVIVAHGFKGFKDWGFMPYTCEQLARQGFAVISFNFSCNGVGETDFDELEKFAVNTYSREQLDLDAIIAHLLEAKLPFAEELDTSRIALLGHSRGGGNIILTAARYPQLQAVVTWNGIADANLFTEAFRQEVLSRGVGYVPNMRTKQQMPISPVFFEDLERNAAAFNIKQVLGSLAVPALLIQGDQDSERLVSGYERMREAAPQHTFVTLTGADHTFGAKHPFVGTTANLEEALRLTVLFLNERLK
ncbi:alpha/beta hydrolase family protein [Paenibacillus algorifonticola]|uniref:alpha/beta hydrolase family protein n=1 Tax=Paenibacillus algorifonticola TaxID=684063 RepID=UPI0006190EA0|nr:alpha/beta fold hydrolase [Paenibacillus algorifonticola]